jgi:hypothetical protein
MTWSQPCHALVPILVKLIASDHYGTEAHRKVAEAGYAPTLFGIFKVEGALNAYIMEYLSPTGGWQTLHEYAKHHYIKISCLALRIR